MENPSCTAAVIPIPSHRLATFYPIAARPAVCNRTAEGAQRFAENVAPIIEQIQVSGITSLRGVAAVLNTRGVRTARGGRWAATQVSSVLARAEAGINGK